jgi:hypothetical protein
LENVGHRINSGGTFTPPWNATMIIDEEMERFIEE